MTSYFVLMFLDYRIENDRINCTINFGRQYKISSLLLQIKETWWLDLQVVWHDQEDYESYGQRKNDRSHFISELVCSKILENKHSHAWLLERKETVGQGYLQNALEIEREQGKSKEHAEKDHEEDAQNQFEIQRQHRQRKEVINC